MNKSRVFNVQNLVSSLICLFKVKPRLFKQGQCRVTTTIKTTTTTTTKNNNNNNNKTIQTPDNKFNHYDYTEEKMEKHVMMKNGMCVL